jgi:hypothetical protein
MLQNPFQRAPDQPTVFFRAGQLPRIRRDAVIAPLLALLLNNGLID